MISERPNIQEQLDRIQRSETFRTSPVLKRLLAFLGEKAISGEGDGVKEYTIAIDGLGKHPSYDPQRDSGVRIGVARLRQKLAEYYRLEGKNDTISIEVPKGQFCLICSARPQNAPTLIGPDAQILPTEAPAQIATFQANSGAISRSRSLIAVSIALVASLILCGVLAWRFFKKPVDSTQLSWTPEIQELWNPFTDPKRPTLLSIASPLYVGFQGEGVYRDLTLDRWDDVLQSPKIRSIQKALGNPQLVPRYYYTGFGDAEAAFELAKLLGSRQPELSLVRSDQLSWQQLSDNNVISVGPPRFFDDQLHALTQDLEFSMDRNGITNLHPRPGEQVRLEDQYPAIQKVTSASTSDEGEIYVLVTNTPGPLGKGVVRSFISNHNPGAFAAMEWFTNPQFAKILVSKLAGHSGAMPRSFQVVLDVRYKDSVPTAVSYVMHRDLPSTSRGLKPANP